MAPKNRMIAFTIIAVILSLITLWIAAGFCSLMATPLLNKDDVGNINIDGSDWTPIFKLGVGMVNGVIIAIFIVIFLAVELVVMPVTWGIFRYAAFRKNPTASMEEFSYTWKAFLGAAFGTLAAALIIMIVYAVRAKSGAPLWALIFCWENPLFMWLLYITKLKKPAG